MLEAHNLTKIFHSDGTETMALNDVSLTIEQGSFVSILGRSGSGKTTLLNIMTTLLHPTSGNLLYDGEDITDCSEFRLNHLRHKDFAVIFQFHYLLPFLTALENVLLPFMNGFAPVPKALVKKAQQSLERVGLAGKGNRLPSQLSGGEQQRVAIARALVKSAAILFADEPTGSLDKKTGESIMSLLKELNNEGLTIVMVTHDTGYAEFGDRIITMEDGKVLSQDSIAAESSS